MVRGGKRNPVGGRPAEDNPKKLRSFRATDEEWQKIQDNAVKHGYKNSVGRYIVKKCTEDDEK